MWFAIITMNCDYIHVNPKKLKKKKKEKSKYAGKRKYAEKKKILIQSF